MATNNAIQHYGIRMYAVRCEERVKTCILAYSLTMGNTLIPLRHTILEHTNNVSEWKLFGKRLVRQLTQSLLKEKRSFNC